MLNIWGHDFIRNREGEIFKPLSQWRKSKCQRGKPIKMSTNHFVFCTQSSRSWLRKLFPWDGKGMEVKFEFGKSHIFGKHIFGFLGK